MLFAYLCLDYIVLTVTFSVKICTEELYGKLVPTAYLYCLAYFYAFTSQNSPNVKKLLMPLETPLLLLSSQGTLARQVSNRNEEGFH